MRKMKQAQVVACVGFICLSLHAWTNPLDDYVSAPDPTFSWEQEGTIEGDGFTGLVLDLKSQTWRTPADVNRVVWEHWVIVLVPDTIKHDTAMLFIGGGRNGQPAPTEANPMLAQFVKATGSVVAEIKQIPNQPLSFHGETRERFEDDLIAYTWDQFRRTGDPTWAARFPMTKAVVRAMDAIQQAVRKARAAEINHFVVSGGSKRGWTTWTTGAVDKRVVAIAPIVIDVLNVRDSMEHHYRAYGFWAPAIDDYVNMGVMNWYDTPAFEALMQLVDPYAYRNRLKMPKFILNSAGDQFFLPDSSQFYFKQLRGEKLLRYVPNSDHGLNKTDAPESLLAWYAAVLNGDPRPEFTWTKRLGRNAGTLRVKPRTKPTKVLLWQATNPDARDFRLETFGPNWKSSPLEPDGRGAYTARVSAPERGWTAFFIELTFESKGPAPFTFTTEVGVVPDILPFDKPETGRSVP